MRKFLLAATACTALLAFNAAAHGPDTPLYGGVVQMVSDLHFELVPRPGGAALYVVDHGTPLDASRMGGKLTVLNGTEKSEAELRPAGANRLEAANVRVGPGSKVVAALKSPDGKPLTVRFTLK